MAAVSGWVGNANLLKRTPENNPLNKPNNPRCRGAKMGIFDKGIEIEEFEKYKKSVTAEFEKIRSIIKSSTSESALEASAALDQIKQSKEHATEHTNEIKKAKEAIATYKASLENEINKLNDLTNKATQSASELSTTSESTLNLHQQAVNAEHEATILLASLLKKISEVDAEIEKSNSIPDILEAITNQEKEVRTATENIKSLLSHSMKRKGDIDEIYKELFGHTIETEDGKSEKINGIRDDLESTYDEIYERLSTIETEAKEKIASVDKDFAKEKDRQLNDFENLISESTNKVDAVNKQLKALLPGGLAAGLSAAYEKKKNEETESLREHEKGFKISIYVLLAISAIPFFVSIKLLLNGTGLQEVIHNTPRVILAILPIYFPVLWLAHSSNKRLNLSKRLIEEYTHKAVLGNTFSGLSNQIETLPHEGNVKEELRTRLLFNILQVSAENPGKLITDYNKTDHPLMDILEKSSKLSDSIDAASKIPGLSSLATKLAERRDHALRKADEKVSNIIDNIGTISTTEGDPVEAANKPDNA